MDCPGGLHTEKGGGERGAFFDQREEDILVGQCWKREPLLWAWEGTRKQLSLAMIKSIVAIN